VYSTVFGSNVRRFSLGRMPSSGMLRRVGLVRTEASQGRVASIIRLALMGELGTMLAVTGFLYHIVFLRRMLRS
jgi:hypothetical protein